MKKITIEIEDQLAKEIKAGKKAIAVINKDQLEDVDGGVAYSGALMYCFTDTGVWIGK